MKATPHRTAARLRRLAVCAVLTHSAGCATPTAEPGAGWFACSRNAQCAFMQDPTDCTRFPINKRYAPSFARHLVIDRAAELGGTTCDANLSGGREARNIVVGHLEYAAICEEARCSSQPRRNRRGDLRRVDPD
jgi:hypothetical protein